MEPPPPATKLTAAAAIVVKFGTKGVARFPFAVSKTQRRRRNGNVDCKSLRVSGIQFLLPKYEHYLDCVLNLLLTCGVIKQVSQSFITSPSPRSPFFKKIHLKIVNVRSATRAPIHNQ